MRDIDVGLRFAPDKGFSTGKGTPKEFGDMQSIQAIILCTRPESRKHIGMSVSLEQAGISHIPVLAMTPNKFGESQYNRRFQREAHLIAACKTLQTPSNPAAMVEAMLGAAGSQHAGADMLFVANDVVLDLGDGSGNWKPCNKLPAESSPLDVRNFLTRHLGPAKANPHGLIAARFRVGAAAYCPGKKRGIAGQTETFFEFVPLSDEDIVRYVGNTDPQSLLAVNAGCMWEQPELAAHIYSIDGIQRDDPEFYEINAMMHLQITGTLPEIHTLVRQAAAFKDQSSLGNLSGDMRTVARTVMPEIEIGKWGFWQPHQGPVI